MPGGRGHVCVQTLNPAGDRVAGRVDIDLDRTLEEPPRRFVQAAGQIPVVLVVDDLPNRGQPDREPDQSVGVAGQVIGQLVVRLEPRDEYVEAEGAQDVRAGEEVRVTDVRLRVEAAQGHLG